MTRKITLLVFLILSIIFVSPLYADSFNCGFEGRNLASEGKHKFQILKDCGPPASRDFVGIDLQSNGRYRIVEEWLYVISDCGHKNMYLIKFDGNGIAVKIDWLGEQP